MLSPLWSYFSGLLFLPSFFYLYLLYIYHLSIYWSIIYQSLPSSINIYYLCIYPSSTTFHLGLNLHIYHCFCTMFSLHMPQSWPWSIFIRIILKGMVHQLPLWSIIFPFFFFLTISCFAMVLINERALRGVCVCFCVCDVCCCPRVSTIFYPWA